MKIPVLASLVLVAAGASAANINLNFRANTNAEQTVAASESTTTALGTTTETWNNRGATATGTAGSLVDGGNTTTGVSVTWNAPGTFTNGNVDATDANGNDFMRGYLDQTGAGSQSITVNLSGITFTSYKLLVYSAGNNTKADAECFAKLWQGTIAAPASFAQIASGTQLGSTFYQTYSSVSNGNTFTQITSTTAGVGNGTNGNYYEFTGLTDSAVTLQLSAIGSNFPRAPINAIQIVDTSAIPEPSTYGLMGAGALAALAVVRRRRRA